MKLQLSGEPLLDTETERQMWRDDVVFRLCSNEVFDHEALHVTCLMMWQSTCLLTWQYSQPKPLNRRGDIASTTKSPYRIVGSVTLWDCVQAYHASIITKKKEQSPRRMGARTGGFLGIFAPNFFLFKIPNILV